MHAFNPSRSSPTTQLDFKLATPNPAESPELTAGNIFIIVADVKRDHEDPSIPVNILLNAADEDSAVRNTLNALTQQGYVHANLHKIGNIDEAPDDEQLAAAWLAASKGEVAVVELAR